MSSLDDGQFDVIESECLIRFDAERRREINRTIEYWSGALMPPMGRRSPRAPGRKDREGKRKRRLGLVYELALHYEIAGEQPKQQRNWDRGETNRTGFARFLELVYLTLPQHARPPSVDTFVRDAERLGFSDSLADRRGGSAARAAYILRTVTAWRDPD